MNTLTLDPLTLAYHELRSPLGLLAMAARSVADDSTDADMRRRCEVIVRTAERMLRTTEQVFGAARAGDSRQEWFSPVEALAQQVTDLLRMGVLVDLRIRIEDAGVSLLGSRGVFEALAQSLFSNAVEHGRPGEPVTVTIDVRDGAFEATISNAIGTSQRHSGLGIGLYIARRLAEQLGGEVRTGGDGQVYHAEMRLPIPAGAIAQSTSM